MHGLSPETDLRFLLGRTLIQLAVGMYQTILHFDAGVAITVAGDFVYSTDEEQGWGAGDNPLSAGCLLGLLGDGIADVRNKGEGEIELAFADGRMLNLFDSSNNAEAYSITWPGGVIVV